MQDLFGFQSQLHAWVVFVEQHKQEMLTPEMLLFFVLWAVQSVNAVDIDNQNMLDGWNLARADPQLSNELGVSAANMELLRWEAGLEAVATNKSAQCSTAASVTADVADAFIDTEFGIVRTVELRESSPSDIDISELIMVHNEEVSTSSAAVSAAVSFWSNEACNEYTYSDHSCDTLGACDDCVKFYSGITRWLGCESRLCTSITDESSIIATNRWITVCLTYFGATEQVNDIDVDSSNRPFIQSSTFVDPCERCPDDTAGVCSDDLCSDCAEIDYEKCNYPSPISCPTVHPVDCDSNLDPTMHPTQSPQTSEPTISPIPDVSAQSLNRSTILDYINAQRADFQTAFGISEDAVNMELVRWDEGLAQVSETAAEDRCVQGSPVTADQDALVNQWRDASDVRKVEISTNNSLVSLYQMETRLFEPGQWNGYTSAVLSLIDEARAECADFDIDARTCNVAGQCDRCLALYEGNTRRVGCQVFYCGSDDQSLAVSCHWYISGDFDETSPFARTSTFTAACDGCGDDTQRECENSICVACPDPLFDLCQNEDPSDSKCGSNYSPSLLDNCTSDVSIGTLFPSTEPTQLPTSMPFDSTVHPSSNPSSLPSEGPSDSPSLSPTDSPSESPSKNPSVAPTGHPSSSPTSDPTIETASPTESTVIPSRSPVIGTVNPTMLTDQPILSTRQPSALTGSPSLSTDAPTGVSGSPTRSTGNPTVLTLEPTLRTVEPTAQTDSPTGVNAEPTRQTAQPTRSMETTTTLLPTASTSVSPTRFPTPIPKCGLTSDVAVVIDNTCPGVSSADCSAFSAHIQDFLAQLQVSDDAVRVSLSFYGNSATLDVSMEQMNNQVALQMAVESAIGDCSTFSSNDGFSDALIRGYESLNEDNREVEASSLVWFSLCEVDTSNFANCDTLRNLNDNDQVTSLEVASGEAFNNELKSECMTFDPAIANRNFRPFLYDIFLDLEMTFIC